MTQIVYINGHFRPYHHAYFSIEDRGHLFADAIYEVIGLIDSVSKHVDDHLTRLQQSLQALDIPLPMPMTALREIIGQIIVRNGMRHGTVYMQISRGVMSREHSYAHTKLIPSIMIMAKPQSLATIKRWYHQGIAVHTKPDIRWQHCDIKTVGLLANCMVKTAAQQDGADDAWMIDGAGYITEGSSANAWIVDRHGVLRTRHLSTHILRGITRTRIIADQLMPAFSEQPFRLEELYTAQEAFQSSASAIKPVVSVDGKIIGDGKPGLVTRRIQQAFLRTCSPHLPALLELES